MADALVVERGGGGDVERVGKRSGEETAGCCAWVRCVCAWWGRVSAPLGDVNKQVNVAVSQ